MTLPPISKILVEEEVRETEVARAILRNAGRIEVGCVPARAVERELRSFAPAEWKGTLAVRRCRGVALRRCQGFQDAYTCCRLHTLAVGNHCPLECTYCALQTYMETSHLSVFANVEDLEAEVRSALRSRPRRVVRVTTGELGDSLALDPLSEGSRRWIRCFRELENGILELKTKTENVEHVLGEDGGGKVVVSWSVNPPEIVEREELKTASLEARLEAAARAARSGYAIGFHLDPIVRYPGWEEAYASLIDALFAAVPAERVAWVSLGALRFPGEVRSRMAERFPGSRLRLGEFVPSGDGKLRYPRPFRIELYRLCLDRLRANFADCASPPLVYLCMEGPEAWSRVFGVPAPRGAELDWRFAESYRLRFPEAGLPETRVEDYEGGALRG
ncbi:MAG: spore photoproduct lyase family protein [Planctomycetota bacterium]